MASIPFPDGPAEDPTRPRARSRAGALWNALLAHFVAAPVAAPFRDSDFEPQWIEEAEGPDPRD